MIHLLVLRFDICRGKVDQGFLVGGSVLRPQPHLKARVRNKPVTDQSGQGPCTQKMPEDNLVVA